MLMPKPRISKFPNPSGHVGVPHISSLRWTYSVWASLIVAAYPQAGKKMMKRSIAKTIAVALLGAGCLLAEAADKPLTFQGRDGAQHTISELRGHPAVVNFWATWCGPCREEMPRLQKLSESYAAQGVNFVAISLDAPETQGKIDAALQKSGLRIPVWTGATDHTLTQLKLGILVPATLILDENGEVIGKIEGEARDNDVQSRLDWLLNGRQGKQPKIVQKRE